jgi:glycerate kinase
MASEPSSRASGTGGVAFAALVGAALLGATFAGDGSDVHGILPVGGAAVVLVAAGGSGTTDGGAGAIAAIEAAGGL